jgi:hypothetical protein
LSRVSGHTSTRGPYGGEWPAERFRKQAIDYRVADKSKSELYRALLPRLNAGTIDLLEHETAKKQLLGLERRALDVEPEPVRTEPIDVPAEIREHARHDRIAEWQRGEDQILSSCRNAASPIEKGFQFKGLSDPVRLRAVPHTGPVVVRGCP